MDMALFRKETQMNFGSTVDQDNNKGPGEGGKPGIEVFTVHHHDLRDVT